MLKKRFLACELSVLTIGVGTTSIVNTDNSQEVTSGYVILSDTKVSPFAVSVGGGTWDYGTSGGVILGKSCWSNYQHKSKVHSSTAKVRSFVNSSGKKKAGVEARSRAEDSFLSVGEAFWNTY